MMGSSAIPAGRLTAFFALGLACTWIVLALLTWTGLQNGVRVSSPFSTFNYGQEYLFSAPVEFFHIVSVLIWHGLAGVIGFAFVIRPVWGGKRLASLPWMIFAGVIPGSILVGAIARLVTLVLPNQTAAWAVCLIVLALATYAGLRSYRKAERVRERSPVWKWGLVSVLALVASFIFQIHMDRGHAVAEGSIWFITNVLLSPEFGLGANGYLPLIAQHYDEVAFLHPLIYLTVSPGPDASATLTLTYWMSLAICRVGMISIVYIALRGLSLDRFSAFLCTAFVCMASLSLNPFSSRLLFDSLSPMAYTLHMARFLAPVLPLLIVSALARDDVRFSGQAAAVALLLGIGLAAMPIHFVAIAAWAGAIVVLHAVMKKDAEAPFQMAAWVSGLVLLLTSFAYLVKDVSAFASVGLLVTATLAGGVLMLWAAQKGGIRLPNWQGAEVRALSIYMVVMIGFVLGLVFLGNVVMTKLHGLLAGIPPWSERELLIRLGGGVLAPEIAVRASPFCESGYQWGYRTVTGHCGSLPVFARTYGLPFVLIASILSLRILLPSTPGNTGPQTKDRLIVWGMITCLLALPAAFIIFDFITPDGSDPLLHPWAIWLRSRLIEPWFIGGMLLALALLLRTAGPRTRTWTHILLMAAIAIHAFNPLIAPAQWVANSAYWFQAIF
jgi:hypothetical protein